MKSLFNQNGELIRIKYGELKGNPKSEWCCHYQYYKVNRFDKNGNKLTSFQDTIFNNNNKKISEFGTYKNEKKDGIWTTFHFNGNLWKIELFENGEQKQTIEEYYNNGIKSYSKDTLSLNDTTVQWYTFKNDSIFLEPIKASYPFDQIIIYKKWNYKGYLEEIEYYVHKSKSANPVKYVTFKETGRIYSYYAEVIKKKS